MGTEYSETHTAASKAASKAITGLTGSNNGNDCTAIKESAPMGEYSSHDLGMVHKLMEMNPRYQIPERLRNKIITTASSLLDKEDLKSQSVGLKVLLEADKRNIDLVKMAIPKKTEIDVRQTSTEELMISLKEILERNPQLLPVIQV